MSVRASCFELSYCALVLRCDSCLISRRRDSKSVGGIRRACAYSIVLISFKDNNRLCQRSLGGLFEESEWKEDGEVSE